MDTSLVATTSTDMRFRANTPNTVDKKPYCPVMRLETMSSSVTFRLSTTLVTSTFDRSRSAVISVPGAVLGVMVCTCLQSVQQKLSLMSQSQHRRQKTLTKHSNATQHYTNLLYEFFTRTPMSPFSTAGCMASGCSTVAPKNASSVASSKVNKGMG